MKLTHLITIYKNSIRIPHWNHFNLVSNNTFTFPIQILSSNNNRLSINSKHNNFSTIQNPKASFLPDDTILTIQTPLETLIRTPQPDPLCPMCEHSRCITTQCSASTLQTLCYSHLGSWGVSDVEPQGFSQKPTSVRIHLASSLSPMFPRQVINSRTYSFAYFGWLHAFRFWPKFNH